MNITSKELQLIKNEALDDCIIYLSGPSSLHTPIDLLRSNSVIGVNGSAGFLLENEIPMLAYVVCDGSFYENNKSLFSKYSSYAQYTFISQDVFNRASPSEKKELASACFVLNDICTSRGGIGRKLKYSIKSAMDSDIFIKCSALRRYKTVAFSSDICKGHFGSATVAFTALQLAISLKFSRVFFSGLDMSGQCGRFYREGTPQPTSLPDDLQFITRSFSFLMNKHRGSVFNLSQETAIPYHVIPFADINHVFN